MATTVISAGYDNTVSAYVWRWSDGSKTQSVYRYDGDLYPTLDAAAEAVRSAEGWDEITTSEPYAIGVQEGRRGSAYGVSCYSSDEECEADETGARAPRIEVLRGEWQWAMGHEDR